jgi:hypothetical protein
MNAMRHGSPDGVKAPRDPAARRGLGRHLEGWQAGAGVVVIAGLAALLVAPRAAVPDVLPLPDVDRAAQHRAAAERRVRAASAERAPLPFAVRAVGEAFRDFGRTVSDGASDPEPARRALLARAARARTEHGPEALLTLRAVQTELFLAAARGEGADSATDVLELGGDFARAAEAFGGVPRPEADLASAFVVRWTLLTGLGSDPAFAPPLNDWRAALRLRLRYPRGRSARDRALEQLDTVRALEQKDPDYPGALARGILAYWLGDPETSAATLRVFLQQNPSGPWQLRARNYLAAALELSQPEP